MSRKQLTPEQRVMVESVVHYIKTEKKKIQQQVEQQLSVIEKQLSLIQEQTAQLTELAQIPLLEEQKQAGKVDQDQLLAKLSSYLETHMNSSLDGKWTEFKRLSDEIKAKSDKSVKDMNNTVETLRQRLNMTIASMGGGGGGLDPSSHRDRITFSKKVESINNGNLTLNVVYGNTFEVTLDQNITSFNLTNWLDSDEITQRIIIYFRQDATGGKTITWPTEVLWPEGEYPEMTTTANALDCIVFETFDGGQTVFGNIAGTNYSAP